MLNKVSFVSAIIGERSEVKSMAEATALEQTAVNHSLERYLGNTIRETSSSNMKATIAGS